MPVTAGLHKACGIPTLSILQDIDMSFSAREARSTEQQRVPLASD
jgi:hypothetical protein